MRLFCITTFLLFHSVILWGQQVTIKGTAIDYDTEEAIPFCNIYVANTTNGVTTDIDGKYQIMVNQATADSLVANSLGYQDLYKKINYTQAEIQINFRLRSSDYTMEQVVVFAGENPANEVVRNIIKRKKENDIEKKVQSFEAEMYSKVELDLDNIPEEMRQKKVFKSVDFIFDNVDSISDVKPFLPAYVAERIYDVFFTQKIKRKEVLKAQKVSGLKNQTVIEFINRINDDYNVYDNKMILLGKEFISPFANQGLSYYEYYILDSTMIKGHWSYKLKFKPKNESNNTFYGDFWVSMDDYAVSIVNMRMSPKVNINLVNRMIIYQEYDYSKNKLWVPTKQKTVIDFSNDKKDKKMGIIGRKTVMHKDYIFDEEEKAKHYTKIDPEDVNLDSMDKDNSFWKEHRHEQLSENEEKVYAMVDSVQKLPIFKNTAELLSVLVSGYKRFGPIKVGPYYNFFTWNDVEGIRLSLGVATSNTFSKKIRLEGYAGYGFGDRRWKYGAYADYVFRRNRRIQIGIKYRDDISFDHRSLEEKTKASMFSGFLRRRVPSKMVHIQEGNLYYQYGWKKGWSNRLAIVHRRLTPQGFDKARLGGLNLQFIDPSTGNISRAVKSSEIVFQTRFAYKERILGNPFKDISMGSRYPIINLKYVAGIKGVLQSDFNYHKVDLSIDHWFYTTPVGWMRYHINVGKIFGTLPALLLETHKGNEAWFYNRTAFNAMNDFEFLSDFYINFRFEHHLEGFILNRIPLIKKLQWRLVTSYRAAWGTLSDANLQANQNNFYDRSIKSSKDREDHHLKEGPFYGKFGNIPYMEGGVGIENIFKVIRVDALWRLTYLDNRDANKFSVRVTLSFDF